MIQRNIAVIARAHLHIPTTILFFINVLWSRLLCSFSIFTSTTANHQHPIVLAKLHTINEQKKKTNRFIPVGSDCIAKFLSVVKSTELFGTVSLLYATVVPVGKCGWIDSILQILFLMSGITIWSGRERLRRQPNVERDVYGISNIFSASTFGDIEM